ncbi:MAG: hypothetical protein AAGA60_18690 [Cyanobacteria bacterium P01_E01_bin.42]
MGIQYGNITLYKVEQSDIVNYLSGIGEDAYVSPTIDRFTTVYLSSVEENVQKQILNLDKLDSYFRVIINRYKDTLGLFVFWAYHLSKIFHCSALAVFVYDGSCFWYHLAKNGVMLDEYTTCAGDGWQPGQAIEELSFQIKGGNAEILSSTFNKQEFVEQIQIILGKASGFNQKDFFNLTRYEALLKMPSYDSPVTRHEAIARFLEICPGLVLGLNYSTLETGELGDLWSDFQDRERDNCQTLEEIELEIQKTT